ncbi:aminoacyl-tRNA hydrolase [Corynebacterium renale]|uniref:aminoacyl-tRNA hydrolase n=1 Tax=Corynebacterium renale TaxID=1724 RepID=UPI000E02697C|nr:peptidyl-tRNA hydrolase [Corynebacterium renale]STC98640.1 peptidyl-tRNA hydrolase [Corynebacterium renale]
MIGEFSPEELEAILAAHALLAARTSDDYHQRYEDPEHPETVQAMQIVLNIPKADPPVATDLYEAAAAAVVGVCLAPQAGRPGAWQDQLLAWYDHRIRKVTRRARNSPWRAVQALPGVTVGDHARAFIPSAVSEVPHEISKLQIKGTQLPADEPGPAPAGRPVVYVDASLSMTTGKIAAQVGHGAMLLAAAQPADWVLGWARTSFATSVRLVDHDHFTHLCAKDGAVTVVDAGFTEIAPDTATVVALPEPPKG